MTLDDILQDIYALETEMRSYERTYGVLSATFIEAYSSGEEPPDDSWVRDWTAWASGYHLWLRRLSQYDSAIRSLRQEASTMSGVIARTARHEPIPVPA